MDLSFDTLTPLVQHIMGGKLRALAVNMPSAPAACPRCPLAVAGLAGFKQERFGIMAPADIVARLNTETVRIIQSEFRKRMKGIGAEPVGDKPAQLAQQIESDAASHA